MGFQCTYNTSAMPINPIVSVSPSKPNISALWKQWNSNPKSMSTDSLGLSSTASDQHKSGAGIKKPVHPEPGLQSANKDTMRILSSSPQPSENYKNFRDNFLSNRHGFTGRVFGVSLSESLSMASAEVIVQSELVSFGRIPIVVAKCGAYLKKSGLETSGIFRIAGNSKRVKELQYVFSSPPDYGAKFNDWDSYTVHDVASLLRRFLNNLKEPLIPLELYEDFRKPLKDRPRIIKYMTSKTAMNNPCKDDSEPKQGGMTAEVALVDDRENDGDEEKEGDNNTIAEEEKRKKQRHKKRLIRDIRAAIKDYEILFISISNDAKQLTIYLLDLLSLFSRQSQFNLMSARNLAAIFQPSVLSHPQHDMDPREYELSRFVTEFLIEYSYKLLPHLLKLATSEQEMEKKEKTEQTQTQGLTHAETPTQGKEKEVDFSRGEVRMPEKLVVTNEDNETEPATITPSKPIDILRPKKIDISQAIGINSSADTRLDISSKKQLGLPKQGRPHSKSFGSVVTPPDVIASNKRRSRLFPWLHTPGILSDNGGDLTATEEEGDEGYFDERDTEGGVTHSPVSSQSNSAPRQVYLPIPSMDRSLSWNSLASPSRRPMSTIFSGSRNNSVEGLEGLISTRRARSSSGNEHANAIPSSKTTSDDQEGASEERKSRSHKNESWFRRLRSRSRSKTRA